MIKSTLSARQWDVAELISHGWTDKEIAEYYNLSRQTIKNHISNILRKSDCRNRTDIATKFIKQEFVRDGNALKARNYNWKDLG